MTTVEVKEPNWRRLHRLKDPGESFDDVIEMLLDEHEAAHETPMADGGNNE